MISQCRYPEGTTLSEIDTQDLLHDYKMMLADFGPLDETVLEYREELLKRKVKI